MQNDTGNIVSGDWVDLSTQELLELLYAPQVSKEARENAVEAIYRRYSQDILNFIQSRVSVYEDIWDIHSEVWKFTFERLRRFAWREDTTSPDPLKSWLMAVTHHKIQEHLRQYPFDPVELLEARLTHLDKYDTIDGFEIEYPVLPPGQFQQRMDWLVKQALQNLSDTERQVIILTYYGDKNSRQIAEQLHLTPVNVRAHRSRAIKKMRIFFQQQSIGSMGGVHQVQGGGDECSE